MEILENVKVIARTKGKTVTEVAKEAGISRNTIQRWAEHFPTVDKVAKVARVLDCSIDEIVRGCV